MNRPRRGFTLIELLIAMAVMVTFSGALMSLILAGQSLARVQPEAADVQQRARIALQTLGAELARAGAGLDRGAQAGPLVRYFPPIGPSRRRRHHDLVRRRAATASRRSTAPLAPGATDAFVAGGGSSRPRRRAIVFSAGGCRDVLRVESATATCSRFRAGLARPAPMRPAPRSPRERSAPTWSTPPPASCSARRSHRPHVRRLDNVTAMSVDLSRRSDAASASPCASHRRFPIRACRTSRIGSTSCPPIFSFLTSSLPTSEPPAEDGAPDRPLRDRAADGARDCRCCCSAAPRLRSPRTTATRGARRRRRGPPSRSRSPTCARLPEWDGLAAAPGRSRRCPRPRGRSSTPR